MGSLSDFARRFRRDVLEPVVSSPITGLIAATALGIGGTLLVQALQRKAATKEAAGSTAGALLLNTTADFVSATEKAAALKPDESIAASAPTTTKAGEAQVPGKGVPIGLIAAVVVGALALGFVAMR